MPRRPNLEIELQPGFRRHPARLLVGAGLVGTVVGSMLPWVEGTDFMSRTFAYNGLTRTSDGWFLIIFALGLTALVMNQGAAESRMTLLRAAPLILSVFVFAAVSWAYGDALTFVREAEVEGGTAAIVSGFWVAVGGAALCILGAAWLTGLDLLRRGGWTTRADLARAVHPANFMPALGLAAGAILGMVVGVWAAATMLSDTRLAWMYFLLGVVGFVVGASAGYRLGGWLALVARGDSVEIRRRVD